MCEKDEEKEWSFNYRKYKNKKKLHRKWTSIATTVEESQ